MTTPPRDAKRAAEFRERARQIVRKDRGDRKLGLTVDTAGAIARALADAYARGFAEASSGSAVFSSKLPSEDQADIVEWMLIPPRPRSAFWTACLFILGDDDEAGPRDAANTLGYLATATTARTTPGWQVVGRQGYVHHWVIADRSVRPMVRLGLIEAHGTAPNRLVITAKGEGTWREFLRRGGRFPDHLPDRR